MSFNLDTICRVCMEESPNMLNLFEKKPENIANKLFYVTSHRALTGDNLPEHICINCSENLEISYKFKKQYENSDNFLRSYISSSTNFEPIIIKEEKIDEDNPEIFPNLISEDQIKKEIVDEDSEESLVIESVKHYSNEVNENGLLELKDYSEINEEKAKNLPNNNENIGSLNILEELNNSSDVPEMTRIYSSNYLISEDQIKKEDENNYGNSEETLVNGIDNHYFDEENDLGQKKQKQYFDIKSINLPINNEHILEESNNSIEITNVVTLVQNQSEINNLEINENNWKEKTINDETMRENSSSIECDSDDEEILNDYTFSRNSLYLCDLCDLVVQSKRELLLHKSSHPGVPLLQCTLCDKYFVDENRLKNHILIHTGEQQFSCKICKTGFNDRSNYLKHMILHSNFKRYKCQICLKTFSELDIYNIHFKKHKGPRRFCCHICNRTFLLKQDLDVHLKTHSNPGVKPFQCSNCNKSFSLKNQLRRHVIIHNKCNQFPCDICKKRFPTENFLKNHIKTHKADKTNKNIYKNSSL